MFYGNLVENFPVWAHTFQMVVRNVAGKIHFRGLFDDIFWYVRHGYIAKVKQSAGGAEQIITLNSGGNSEGDYIKHQFEFAAKILDKECSRSSNCKLCWCW